MNVKFKKIKNVICATCNKCFLCNDDKKNKNRQFCSRKCASWLKNLGKKRTEAFKTELSLKMKGVGNPFFGKKHSEKTKLLISDKNKWEDSDFNYCELSEQQMEIFDGLMLSDLHLEASKTSARITCGFKFIETLYNIQNIFNNLHFSNPSLSKSGCYHFKSHCYKNLLDQRYRWYQSGVKIVPNDVRITPLSCLWWFLGDGYQLHYGVGLCTDSYSLIDIEYLIDRLDKCGFKSSIIKRQSFNRIRISGVSKSNFLNWIKSSSIIPDQYLYKFADKWRTS